MRLHDVEPDDGPGSPTPLLSVVDDLLARRSPPSGPFLLAIDGRSSNGKSTLAARIADARPDTAVVHTDDVAWWHSRFGWDDLLLDHVIAPLRRGHAVHYRPPAWSARGRSGSIEVPADATLVVIEGVGSARRSLRPHVDAVVWVQTSLDLTEPRDAARVAAGETDQVGYDGWMAEEVPFQAAQRTWEHADVVVSGAPELGDDVVVLHRRTGSSSPFGDTHRVSSSVMAEKLEVSREIAAPPEAVYAAISDVTRMGEWSVECHSCEWHEGFDGPAVGATFDGHNRNGDKTWTTQGKVIEADPGKAFAFECSMSNFHFSTWGYRIEPTPSGGSLVTEWSENLLPPSAIEMSQQISGITDRTERNRQTMSTTLERLAAALEG